MKHDFLLEVIRAPHISEKSTLVAEKFKQVVFKVGKKANKHQIKDAVEQVFKVKVKTVTTTQVREKPWKKAYVTLMPDFDIDFSNSV